MDTGDTAVGMPDGASIPKSPKKRDRTDSMKKLVQQPASQRSKQEEINLESLSQHSNGRLVMKDRKGSSGNVVRAHLILNAVKQAPPPKEKSNPRRWSKQEDESLRLAVERSGERNWKAIADQVPGRNHTQCLQRWTKVLKPGLIKGHWTSEEDDKLRELVAEGKKNWGQVASLIPGRTSKQCRERWCNHLDPNINKGAYTEEEDKIIVEMQAKLGNRWSIIAQQLTGRTEDAVKIRWKSLMRSKRAALKGDKQREFHGSKAGPAIAHKKPKGSSKGMQKKTLTHSLHPVVRIFENGQSLSHHSVGGSTNTPAVVETTQIINPVSNILSEKRNIGKNQHLYSAKSESSVPLSDNFRTMYQTIAVGPNHFHSNSQGSSTQMDSEASITPVSTKPKLKTSLATSANHVLPTEANGNDQVESVSEPTLEEWGSAQTPRSQMILTEGHASAFELFHQQRLRLILRERERGLSVTSAPSPGQAMLTKELEENKARQNRQAILQNGWRTAVESIFSDNNESNEKEHFEDLMEKVNLSLDPSDDDLIDGSQPDMVVSTVSEQ